MNYVSEYKTVYKAMLRNPSVLKFDQQYREVFAPILNTVYSRFGIPEDEAVYWSSFYIDGSVSVIRKWIHMDCEDDIDKIENILLRCILHDCSLMQKKSDSDCLKN